MNRKPVTGFPENQSHIPNRTKAKGILPFKMTSKPSPFLSINTQEGISRKPYKKLSKKGQMIIFVLIIGLMWFMMLGTMTYYLMLIPMLASQSSSYDLPEVKFFSKIIVPLIWFLSIVLFIKAIKETGGS